MTPHPAQKTRSTKHCRIVIGVVLWLLAGFVQAEPPEVRVPERQRIFLEDYCFDCHDSATRKGKVDLEELPFEITTIEQAERWQKVLNSLNSGEMPPEDKDQPENGEKADFLDDLANTMVVARKALSDSGGRITMRRLNQREYRNTIEALTGSKVNVDSLPVDGGGGTFDTIGSSQFISSDQLEQYLTLGRAAIDEAFERQASRAREPKVFRVEPEKTVNVSSLKSIRQLEEAQERFMRWKAGVDKAAAAPENREIMARILKENPTLDPSAFPSAAGFQFYRHAQELIGAPDPKKFGFKDDNAATFSFQGGYSRKHAYLKHYAGLPHNDRGTYLKLAWGIQRIDISPKPKDLPPGTYTLRVRAGVVEGSPPSRHFIEVGHPQRVNQVPAGFAGSPIGSRQVTGTIENPEVIEIQIEVSAHTPREFSVQERQPNDPKSLRDAFNRDKRENGYGTPPAIWVDWVELEGPTGKPAPPKPKTVRLEPEEHTNRFNEKQAKKIEDNQARFSRWKVEVDKAIATPANQKRIKELVKENPQMGHPIHFYKFVELLEGVPDASKFGFKDAFEATLSHPDWDRSELAYHKHYLALPHRDRGTYLKLVHGVGRLDFNAKDYKPGTYILRIRAGAVEDTPASRRFIEVGHPGLKRGNPAAMSLSGAPISKHQITGTIAEPQIIETRVEVSSRSPRIFSVRERQPDDPMALWDAHNRLKRENGYGHPPAIWIDWMEMEGPLVESNSPSWKQRREVELHANRKVGGTYRGWLQGGHDRAKKFRETGEPQGKPEDMITDEAEAKFRIRQYEREGPSYRRYLEDPMTQTGSYLSVYAPHTEEIIALPPEHPSGWLKTQHVVDSLPSGNYKIRFRIGAVKGTPGARHFVELGAVPQDKQFTLLKTLQVTGSTEDPQVMEATVSLTENSPRKFALREKRIVKGDHALFHEAVAKTGVGPEPALWIDWVEWEGPLPETDDSSTIVDQWVAGDPGLDEATRARMILENFAVQALRGTEPGSEFIDRLLAIFESRRKGGEAFGVAIRTPLSIILASPGFLYLNEPGNEDHRRELNDRELAVRLSYFLWSAPPDERLLDLAERNELGKPAVLREEVDRLIADPRSDEFIAGFVHQWLDMERLDFFQFDPNLHREFDESTRAATREEVYQSFAHLLRGGETGHLGQLIKSDHVFINGLLATYYGIEGVTGDEFRKVKVPADSPRGGLLGMAAIHAMGSDGIESSPVERGAWVLRHLLNDPPPPAPPNVPQLSRLADKPLNTRQRLAAHMEEAQCATCHRKIDPIGFGLENFDAAGKWRTVENFHTKDKKVRRAIRGQKTSWPIDPSGKLHKGPAFEDYFELRDVIAGRNDDFARGFAEHLIQYALGRPFGFTDEDLANEITTAAKTKDYAVSEFIQAIVRSEPFHRK